MRHEAGSMRKEEGDRTQEAKNGVPSPCCCPTWSGPGPAGFCGCSSLLNLDKMVEMVTVLL